jgi:hypothetical protein
MSVTSFDPLIAAVQLCPALFKNKNPKLVSISLGKAWASILTWEIVIDDHLLDLSIFDKGNSIEPIIISPISYKHRHDPLWVLSEY